MKIILATDGTKYGDAALKMLANFALDKSDEITVITVVDMALPLSIDMYGGFLPETAVLENAARENASKIIDESVAKIGETFSGKGVAVSGHVLFGSPDSRIVETAEKFEVDLILIGSHGYNRWERLLLGSVSNSVVNHAHCSVLIVRTDAD
ncbi:universal stress protein [soil metagenome]